MGIVDLNKPERFFQVNALVYSLLRQTERKDVFFGRGRQGVRLPQIAFSFNETKKVSPFVKFV